MANVIRQKLNTHAGQGRAFIEARTADLNSIYLEARRSIERRIEQYVKTGSNSFTGPRMVKLMEEVQAMFPEFEEQYRETAKEAISYIAQSYYRSALSDLSLKGSVTDGFNKEQFQLTLDDAYTHIAGATQKMSDYSIYNLRKLSAQVMREASLTGETRAFVSRKLYAANCSDGFFQFRARNGVAWNSEAYFDMLGRTLLHNSARESYLQGCSDNGSDIVTISTSGNPCPKCAKHEGRLYSISGNHPKYPPLQSAIDDGMFHPNCTHRTIAVPEAIAETDYDENGRPLQGINSAGNEEKDDKEAWKKYRQDQKPEKGKKAAKPRPADNTDYEQKRDKFQQSAIRAGSSKEVADTLADCYTPEIAKRGEPPLIVTRKNGTAFYRRSNNTLHLNTDPESWHGCQSTARHEFGHHVDELIRKADPQAMELFHQAADKDWEQIKSKVKLGSLDFRQAGNMDAKAQEYFGKIYSELDVSERHVVVEFFDTIGSITNGKYGGGHTRSYYKKSLKNNEAWANIFSAVIGNIDKMQKDFPRMSKIISLIAKGQ